jgi:hypothetical protein
MSRSKFTTAERAVINALMDAGPRASVSDRAARAIAARAGMTDDAVASILRGLNRFDPPVVHHDVDAVTGVEVWFALNEAAERLDPPRCFSPASPPSGS